MPAQGFVNLWETIKAGRPWDGLVKNRTTTGSFYWVRANVTPAIENDRVTGYISIRSRPARAAVAAAEQAYTAPRNGTARGIALRDGELVSNRMRDRLLDTWQSLRGRMVAAAFVAFLAIATVGWLGFSGMASSNAVPRTVYENDLVSVDQLRGIVDRIRDNRNHIAQLTISLGSGERPDALLRITGLMAEVSRESRASGEQAGQLRGNAGAVADDVAALRTALVRTVRTASKEADRRLEPRVAVDVACSVRLDGAGAAIPGRLLDISVHGANIDVGEAKSVSVGQTGDIVLAHAGNARARPVSGLAASAERCHWRLPPSGLPREQIRPRQHER